jgi:hypothetical protein
MLLYLYPQPQEAGWGWGRLGKRSASEAPAPPCLLGRSESKRRNKGFDKLSPTGLRKFQCPKIFDKNSRLRSLCGLLKKSCGLFCSTICPWSMKITRLATAFANPISWVTQIIVMP